MFDLFQKSRPVFPIAVTL
uniref:Uncharacterized protein n=1 Tax=Anguilla anguilla TaxID=7936 RepID=A0A0E9XST6_ANGAN